MASILYNSFITEWSEPVESWGALSMSVTLLPFSLKGPWEARSLEFPKGSKEIHTAFFFENHCQRERRTGWWETFDTDIQPVTTHVDSYETFASEDLEIFRDRKKKFPNRENNIITKFRDWRISFAIAPSPLFLSFIYLYV